VSRDQRYGAFIWNRDKEERNIDVHGIDFKTAAEAFADPHRLIARDDKHASTEERLFYIGVVQGRVATVRFTYRVKSVRIYGAGFWRKGRKMYEKSHKARF
jgi:hypothetical protein